MAKHLYAETLLTPGLGIPFQWRYGGSESDLLSLMDRESPVYGALEQSINRFDYTTFDLALNKPTLIEWANSQSELQDAANIRELRLGAASWAIWVPCSQLKKPAGFAVAEPLSLAISS